MKSLYKVSIIMMAVVLLAACTPKQATVEDTAMKNQGTPTQEAPMVKEVSMENDTMEKDEAAQVDYTIEMSKYKFEPNVIKAAPGQTITVKVVSVDGLHDLVIDELDVKSTQLMSGKGEDSEEVFEITVPEDVKSGTEYEFYCSVGNHRELGMVGTFMVE